MEYNSLFSPSLWMDTEGRLHHERSIIQLPFFTEALPFFHEKRLSLSEHIDKLLRRRGEISMSTKIPLEPMNFQQVQSLFSLHLLNYRLGNQEGTIELPLKAIYTHINHTYRELFMEMTERLCENITYFIADYPKKLIELKELRFDPESGQVLINGEAAYTPTQEGGLVPLFAQSLNELCLYAVPKTIIPLDQLDEATYPQLHLVSEALQRGETYKKIAPRTIPIALLSEIEDTLSKVEFQLAKKDEPTNQETSLAMNKKDIISIVKEQVNEATTNDTFFFANINKVKPVWWIEPNKDHFLGSWLLLNNKDKKEVHVFKINNSNFFKKLTTREDRDTPYRLEILTEQTPNHFIDRFSNVDFKEYYIQTIKY